MIVSTAAGWAVALAVLIAASVAAHGEGRMWARRAVALLALYLIALALADWLLPPPWAPWGAVLAAFAVLLTAQPFIALGLLKREEIGLNAPRAGSMRVVVIAIGLALLLNVVIMLVRGAAPVRLGAGAVAAVMVGAVLEEIVFRGVLLALLDRALPQRWRLAGAYVGWGGVALTASFVALHGLRPGLLLGVVPAALLYLWLRERTGSLLAPIAAHLAWNLSVLLVH
ncbi:MAG: CPBP family intramembrane glutamic endopeptidase [Burkholderiaceae bacterium]